MTLAASSVVTTNATLNAFINPNGAATSYYFQYGTSNNSYDLVSITNTLPAGYANVDVSEVIVGLATNTTHYFRVVAVNSEGTNFGAKLNFKTTRLLLVVTNLADSGNGTLRAICDSAQANDVITFAANLSGGTILLTNGQITLRTNVTIDASALTNGIRIDANEANRLSAIPF